MKPNYETIYLVPTDYDGGQLTYSWCDCPAQGEGMDPADAIKYVRADLVPASNELLARRVVELTNERDAALTQLVEVQNNRTGKAPCERFCEALATKKMFDNLQSDNRQLKAQVEQLRDALLWCLKSGKNGYTWEEQDICGIQEDIDKTPAQCLVERDAEVAAKAIDGLLNAGLAHGTSRGLVIGVDTIQEYAKQIKPAG